ncbi:tandem-95 repeat protein [Methylobacterium aquaticum]|uniref:tandem-95 repeat protein n=1 Tax=Methylobacterium aquaticum TaxID=270351 RepID=UPI0019330652|nr:tandem-95 repeat protein [Methylobacterium aquaticum]
MSETRVLSKTRAGSEPRVATGAPTSPAIRALEPRFVFDGAAAPAAAQSHGDPARDDPAHGDRASGDEAGRHAEPAEARAAAPVGAPLHETATASGRHEIVVIDEGAADVATLIAGVPSSAEIILIDPARDGFDQLAEALEGRSGIDAIHILSHGSAGDLRLGTGDLTAETIRGRYAADLAVIGKALTATGDLMIYGCDFAAGEAGARAVALLASATGADIAASDDATGAAELGGDWTLETHRGAIETGIVVDAAAQADWHHLLAAADNGRGALLAVSNHGIYSVDIASGKATELTQAPGSVGGITLGASLNSLAVDQANGLIYYVDNASPNAATRNALFAYDFRNDRHILIDADLSTHGVTTGSQGLGGAGAAFANGTLYLAVENVSGTTDQIYRLTFTGSGRTVASGATFGSQANHEYDWGDIGIDQAGGQLVSLTRGSFARFSLGDGREVLFDNSVTRTDVQTGVDSGGFIYTLGTNITRLDPTSGAAIGSGKAITTDGSTPLGTINDAASWTPPTSTIGGRVFGDANANGTSDSGEAGLRGVTVQLVDDVNGNGRVDAGERVLATDTSAADGSYSFTGLLPGQFVVRVTDTEGRLTTATATTPTSGALADTKVGATLAGPDFGYNPALVLDLDASAAGTGYATRYTERAPGVAIVDADVSILSAAGTTLTAARAVIANGTGAETLRIVGTLPAGLGASYDPATSTLTLTGSASLADYQAALQQIRYASTGPVPSPAERSIAVTVSDGTVDSAVATATVTVVAANAPPVNTLPASQGATEDTDLVFSAATGNAVRVDDRDGGPLTVTLSADQGLLSLSRLTGLTFAAGDGANDAAMTFTGSIADIDAALDGLRFAPRADYNGSARISLVTRDPVRPADTFTNGSFEDPAIGGGYAIVPESSVPGWKTDATDHQIEIWRSGYGGVPAYDGNQFAEINANQVAALYQTFDATAGSTLSFDFAHRGRAGVDTMQVKVTDLGADGVAGTADDSTLFDKTYSDGNTAWGAYGETIAGTASGNTLRFEFRSIGAAGGSQSVGNFIDGIRIRQGFVTASALDVTIAPVADIVPDAVATNENTAITVNAVTGTNGAAADNFEDVTRAVTAVTQGAHGSVAFQPDGTLTYTPDANFAGTDRFTYTVAAGGTTETAAVTVTVRPVNRAPILDLDASAPGTGFRTSYGVGGPAIAIVETGVAVTDVDNAQMVSARAVITNPQAGDGLTFVGTPPAGIVATYDPATSTLTLTGAASKADYQAALQQIRYASTGSAPSTADRTIAVTVNDGTVDSAVATATVTVVPANAPPVNTLPVSQTLAEDTSLVLSAGNGNAVTVSDPDAGTGALTTTLGVAHGTLTLGSRTGVTVTNDGTGAVTLTGTAAAINAALDGTTYRPAADYNGPETLTIVTTDNGNTGAGGPRSDTDTLSIAVTAVNDAPTNTVPAAMQVVTEDTPLIFSARGGNAVSVADVDGGTLTVALSSSEGRLTLSGTAGLTFLQGTGTGDRAMRVSGSIAAINAALDGLRFDPAADRNGPAQIALVTVDPAGATAASTIAVTVLPVADIVPDAVATNEDTAITFNAVTGTNGASADTFADGTRAVTAVSQGAHGSVAFQPDGTLTYTPDADFAGTDRFTYTVTAGGTTETATVTVTVRPINDAPVLDLSATHGYATRYTEGGPGVAIVGTGMSVTDVDSATLASATAVITNGQAGDALSVEGGLPAGLVARFDPATFTLTLTGAATTADYQTALGRVRFSSSERDPSTLTRSIAVSVSDGALRSAVVTATVEVAAVNDAPVNGLPEAQATAEDTPLVFSAATGNAVTVSDPDARDGRVTTTLGVLHGTLTLGSRTGVTVTNDGTGAVTLTGTIAAINAALDGTTYRPAADYNGPETLTIVTTDNGNTGAGGPKSDADTLAIAVNPVNDAPTNTVPAAMQVVNEDTPLIFSARGGNAVSVADVDGGTLTVALSSAEGQLTLSRTAGLTFLQGTGTGDRAVRVSGSAAAINAALDGLRFDPAADRNGPAQIALVTVDPAGAMAASTIAVTIAPVADIVPDAVATNEDTAITFNAVTGTNGASADTFADGTRAVTAISQGAHGSVAFQPDGTLTYTPDADFAGTDRFTYTVTAGGTTETATVTVTVRPVNDAPVLDLSDTHGYATRYTEGAPGVAIVGTGMSVTDIDSATLASATAVITNGQAGDALSVEGGLPAGLVARFDPATFTLTLTGAATTADYQTALGRVRFSSSERDPSTLTRSIAVSVSDGALRSAVATATVEVAAVNDAPVNGLPGAQATAEDTPLVFSAATGNAVTVSDPDARDGRVTTTLGVLHGTLTLGSRTGVTVMNDGTGAVTLTGTIAAINAALDGTIYRPAADYNGPETLTIVTTDNGNTGAGGPESDTDTLAIAVAAVNDAPVNGVPGPQSVDEDTGLVFSPRTGNAIIVADVDAGSGAVTVLLHVRHGTLTPGGTANVTVTGAGTGSVSLSGTLAAVNAALDGTTYRADADYAGSDILTMATTDNGNTGAGGPRSDTDTIAIAVNPVNDAPTNTVPAATQAVNEDTPLIFSARGGNAVSVADVDGGTLTVALSSAEGRLTLSGTAGLTFLQGTGTGDRAVRVSGSVAAINAALDGLRFDPAADRNGPAQIALVTVDPAGATAASTIAVTVLPVADIVPDAVATNEDTAITFNAVTGTNGASADTFADGTRAVTAVSQGAHGSVAFQPDGTLTYTPDADFAGTDRFTYTVTAGGTTETATVTVTVRPVNDAPVLDLSDTHGYATRYTEGAPGVAIVGTGMSVTDIDSATLASATAVITNGQAGDALSVEGGLPAGLVARFDPATFTLTLTGAATTADYQTALGRVRFSSSERDPSTLTRSIAVSVSDGALRSAVATATVEVAAVNDAPVNGLPGAQATAEDTPLVFSAATGNAVTVSDPDARDGRVTTTLGVLHGTLTLGSRTGVTVMNDGTGAVTLTGTIAAINAALDGTTYRPAADHDGPDALTIVTTDNGNTGAGGPKSDIDVLALTVSPVNDAPRAGTLPAIIGFDGDRVAGLDLGRTFSDVEGDRLTFGVSGLPAGLTVDSATGIVRGAIDRSASRGGTNGEYAVTVTAEDGHGGATRRSFTWRVVDPAPIARNDDVPTDARTPIRGSVLADNGHGADSDPDGDPLTVVAVGGSAAGIGWAVAGSEGGRFTVLADGSYRFDPGADFDDLPAGRTRATQIAYTIDDGDGGSATAILTVTVTGLVRAPAPGLLGDRSASDGEAVVLPYGGSPDGPAARYGATGLPPGLAIDPATGTIQGTIDRAASGATGLTDYRVVVTATGPGGAQTETRFTLRVTNPAPQARDDSATTAKDRPVVVDVLANDRDPDGDPLAIVATGAAAPRAGHGRVAVADGALVYTPDADFNGTDTITYAIADGNGGTGTASVTVTVTPVNDGPSADILPDQAGRGGAAVIHDIATHFHDPDADRSTAAIPGEGLRFTATGLPPGLSLDPATGLITGRLPVEPAATIDFTVTVTATDAEGASIARSFTWTVTEPVPTAGPDDAATRAGTPVSVAVTANDSDPDGPVRLVDAPGATHAAHGTVSVDPATGRLTYVPDDGFSGTDTVAYTIENQQGGRATGLLTVAVSPVNRPPVAPDTLSGAEAADGESVRLPLGLLFVDPEGARLAYTATGLPPGLAIDPATGEIAGTIRHDASGPTGHATYMVTLTATDGSGLAVSRTLAWAITNPAPSAADDVITTDEDRPVDIDVTGNDHDPDGDPLAVVAGSVTARHGTVAINPDGSLRYTPDPDFNGADTIVYTITDGNGGFATASVAVAVNPVDDAPVVDSASPIIADRSDSDAARVSIPAGHAFSDVDEGDVLTFTATGLPPGLAIDPATGEIAGTIRHDASGPTGRTTYAVTLTATDGSGLAVSRTLAWAIANPAPSAADDVITTDEDRPVDIDVTGNDHDPDGDPLAVVAGSVTARHGTVAINPDGSLRYTPDPDFNGADTIVYTITDGNGGFATATVAVGVNPVDDAPVVDSTSPIIADRSDSDAARVSIPAGHAFGDVDEGDVLTFSATGLPPGLAIDPVTGEIAGTLASDASTRVPGGVYAVTLTGTDSAGASATARFTITVGNPAPIARDDLAALDEDGLLEGRVLDNDADPDGDAMRVDPMPVAGPLHGRLDLRADGTFTYRPEAGFHGEDSFAYAVVDSDGGRSTAMVRLTVASIDTLPEDTTPEDTPPKATAAPVTTREDTPVDGRIIVDDPGDAPPTFAVEMAPASGQVTLRPDGGFTYTPATDFHGADGFTVRVSTETGGSTLVPVAATIVAVNDAPDAHADALAISAGEVGRGRVVATDPDGDPLDFRLQAGPANGTVVLAEDGSYAYTPATGFSGRDSFTVEVGDGSGGVARATVAVTVAAKPVLVPPPGASAPLPGARLLLDAPAMPPAPAHDTGIVADGFVLQAVAAIDPLGSVGQAILAKGAIVAAVNGVDDLHGTAIDIDRPVVLDAGDRIGRLAWERFERQPDGRAPWFSASPYLGRSLGLTLSTDETVTGRGDLTIEAIRRPDTLVINLRNRTPDDASVGNVRLLGPDGAPVPAWIEGDGRGSFWGRPPAGTRLVAVEVEIALRDGRVVRWPMTVDVETGEIRATAPARPGAGRPPAESPGIGLRGEAPMFTARLASLERDGHPDLTLIETALRRGAGF